LDPQDGSPPCIVPNSAKIIESASSQSSKGHFLDLSQRPVQKVLRGRVYFLLLAILLTACVRFYQAVDYARLRWLSPSQRLVVEGDRLASEGRASEALLAYQQAVDLDSRNGEALSRLGRAYAAQGRRRTALRYLEQSLALSRDDQTLVALVASLRTASNPTGNLPLAWMYLETAAQPTGVCSAEGQVLVAWESGQIASLDAADGRMLWQVMLPTSLTSAPAAGDGRVFVGAQDGSLYALSAVDGHQLWKVTTHAPIYAPAALEGGRVILASSDGSLYALAARDGSPLWTFTTGGPLHARPTVAGGSVFAGSNDGRLYALDAATGRLIWPYGAPTDGPVESTASVLEDRVVFGSGDSRVYAFSAASGGEYWRYSTPDSVFAQPLVEGDSVYVASFGGVLAALDLLTGQPRWALHGQPPVRFTPALAGNALYFVGERDANLYALDKVDGRMLWKMDTGDWFAAGPTVMDGRLILAGKDGAVLAYRLP
jgi:outer membrane protein assembly factor BamB